MIKSSVVPVVPLPRELTKSDLLFLAEYLKTDDLGVAKDRVVTLWNNVNASGVHVYGCIKEFFFLTPSVDRRDRHKRVIEKYRKEGKRPFWLEVGCAFGTDVRKIILSGWPSEDVLALDVVSTYWELGTQLYGDTPSRYIEKDIAKPTPLDDLPQADVVYSNSVLHVLNKEQVAHLVSNIFTLLKPNGTFWGATLGSDPEGPWLQGWWLHSEKSLRELFESIGFVDITVLGIKLSELEEHSSITMSEEFKAKVTSRPGGYFFLFEGRKA